MSCNSPVWRHVPTLPLVLWDGQTDVFGLTVAVRSPPGDPAAGSVMEGAVGRGQADWVYIVCEVDGGRQLEEADVVVYGQEVVQRVAHGSSNGARLFLWVGARLAVAAQMNRYPPVFSGHRQRDQSVRPAVTGRDPSVCLEEY